GELKGLFKLRIGSYRAVYSIDYDKRLIVIHLIDHRKDIYR
ncbi:MAG: type II toxin-antitoxin system RelE/ParE family toxin, partial [Proteobacteria bacterium]|nr:type II toxin-antitoxin system RelE/ParE family toxin [Pseudomonadota bacterium]